ncbi:MAG: DUF4105 domain-containing protein [Gammaproteobacteria bacterium]|nr:DUF4105 domain-containing protein [Gammaproteobacteria bacterium]
MKKYLRPLFWLALLALLAAFSPLLRAATPASGYLASLQQQMVAQQLWQQPAWLNLIHYRNAGLFSGSITSAVVDARFFLAANGRDNPQQELAATLTAFFATAEAGDKHAQCRYPARFAWLVEQLNIHRESLPQPDCHEFKAWYQMVKAVAVTLVFPAYHLNSPSSMFGHTLLRLDKLPLPQRQEGSDWLSFAVNFGANVDASENSLLYAFKGLTGGYHGLFIVEPYYEKIKEYNRDENRDIWEYPLNLTEAETQRLITHLWELFNINFAYYFFDENCSYRVLELLEVAREGVDLTSPFRMTAIPIDTVRAVYLAGMADDSDYRPAKLTQLQQQLQLLSDSEATWVEALTQQSDLLESSDFLSMDVRKRYQLVDTAYQLLQFRTQGEARDNRVATQRYLLLQQLAAMGGERATRTAPPVPTTPPHAGHESRRLALGFSDHAGERRLQLGYKLSYHQLEDAVQGYLPGAAINMGDFQFAAKPQQLRLEQLEVIDIFSLTPRNRFMQPVSWRVSFGLDRIATAQSDPLVLYLEGGGGVAYGLGRAIVYGLAVSRLESPLNDGQADAGLGVHGGLLWHFKQATTHLQLESYQFKEAQRRVTYQLTQQQHLTTALALRLQFTQQESDQIPMQRQFAISLLHYF